MALASHGWRVHPLQPRSKFPRLNAWQNAASTDEEVITTWWEKWPKANVGVVMGPDSGIIDLECDSPEAETFLAELFRGHEHALDTATFRSSRGTHRLFKYTDELPNSDKANWRLPGIDIDFKIGNGGKGSYCVFPPSVHESGAVYRWTKHPDDYGVKELPLQVVSRLHTLATEGTLQVQESKRRPQEHWDRIFAGVGEGERNEAAASLIGKFVAAMSDPSDPKQQKAQYTLIQAWNQLNSPPLSEDELRRTFRSIVERHCRNDHFDESPDSKSDSADARLRFLQRALELPELTGIVRRGSVKANYELKFTDGTTLDLGTMGDVVSVSKVRTKLLDERAHLIKMDKRKWPRVAQAIREIAQQVETGDKDQFARYVEEFAACSQIRLSGCDLELEPGTAEWWGARIDAIRKEDYYRSGCFLTPDGHLWLHQPKFMKYVRDVFGARFTPEELCSKLTQHGFEYGKTKSGHRRGVRVQARLWTTVRPFQVTQGDGL
jgi:hypothetical protein